MPREPTRISLEGVEDRLELAMSRPAELPVFEKDIEASQRNLLVKPPRRHCVEQRGRRAEELLRGGEAQREHERPLALKQPLLMIWFSRPERLGLLDRGGGTWKQGKGLLSDRALRLVVRKDDGRVLPAAAGCDVVVTAEEGVDHVSIRQHARVEVDGDGLGIVAVRRVVANRLVCWVVLGAAGVADRGAVNPRQRCKRRLGVPESSEGKSGCLEPRRWRMWSQSCDL